MSRKLKEPLIFGMCGLAGSGKDTAANYIEQHYQALGLKTARIKFATALKDIASILFSLDRQKLEGMTPEDREWREQPLEDWSKRLGHEVTPRILLQELGTDVLRTHFHQNIWVDCLAMKIQSPEYEDVDVFVITDCRFPNELQWLADTGAYMFEVRRFEPQWYLDYVNNGTIPEGIHVSEYAWINPLHALKERYYKVGFVDCTIDQLYGTIQEALYDIPAEWK